eukprot:CAMPEP_0195067664 /NCGR_PEP_ID=MMETSP0448-20130528/12651_1 /TAXON_ID=66468 /ORGANISM="Heterocapsa triquestra, Strain CCMP 448" /LENGTH=34 /DNA_ID= /DNA_START= /DNA_END= /DNA_ORIENTATION=
MAVICNVREHGARADFAGDLFPGFGDAGRLASRL